MNEQEVKIQSEKAVLAGTLCMPSVSGRFPAVLMVHGSGPLDRNENMKGQRLNIFNAIAHALAEHGIASLRYDKRGCGKSSGDFISSGHSDFLRDAVQCMDYLAASESIFRDKIFVLGHSEGSIIAPQLAHQRPLIAGLVLLCPFFERFESVLLRQSKQIEKEVDSLAGLNGFLYRTIFRVVGKPSAQQRRLIRKVRETDTAVVRFALSRQPAKWIREMLDLDVGAIFASTRTPMLLVAGEKDLQCNPQDIFRIADTAQSQSEALVVKGMTHLLRIDENPASIMGSMRLAREPLEAVVTERTIQWVSGISAFKEELRTANNTDV